jgi:phenylacetate-CoA ligase
VSATNGGWRGRTARAFFRAHPARPSGELDRLAESQWWPEESLRELQSHQLSEHVAAAGRVPFYRQRLEASGVDPDGVRSLDDLPRLPILERDDLRRLGVKGLRASRRLGIKAFSSGSAGQPVEILWPFEQMRWRDASEERGRAWLGVGLGERRLEVRCRPVKLPQAFTASALNTVAIHAPTVSDRGVVERLAEALERNPPALVHGVSNAIYRVALALLDQGRTVEAGACWSGGNHLHSHYRAALEAAFHCPVYERYATMEVGLVAHECAEGGSLHVPAEGVIVEIVRPDGSPADPGEVGEVLVTSLRNLAMPLIRYRIGDRAIVPEKSRCSCGRGLPVFGTVVGRSDGFLRTRRGELLSPGQVVDAVRSRTDGVIDFQVIQEEDARVRVLVVQQDAPPPDPDRERIAAALSELVEPPEPPRVDRVELLPISPGGKVKTLVSRAGQASQ